MSVEDLWRISGSGGHGTTSFWPWSSDRSPGSIHYLHARPAVGWEVCTHERGGGVTVRGMSFTEALLLVPELKDHLYDAQARMERHTDAMVARWLARQERFRREREETEGRLFIP